MRSPLKPVQFSELGAYSRCYADYQRSKPVHHTIPSLGHRRLDELTATDVERWLVQTKRGSTAANANIPL